MPKIAKMISKIRSLKPIQMNEAVSAQEEEKKDKYNIFKASGVVALLRENGNDHAFIQAEVGKRIITLSPKIFWERKE